jgi:NADH-quinone oxidoreductase subunit E
MSGSPSPWFADLDRDFINKVVDDRRGRPGALLAILQAVQNRNPRKYLPREAIAYVAERAGVPLSRVWGVVTFYALFNLKPQGRNTICVCRGTACHTRGSKDLLDKLVLHFGLGDDAEQDIEALTTTTADGAVTLRTVACFGQCALAPVVEVNHVIFGHMSERTLERELDALERPAAQGGGRP